MAPPVNIEMVFLASWLFFMAVHEIGLKLIV